MASKFEKLLEESGLNEDTRSIIQETWNEQIVEAKEEISAQLREEFSKKFEHDKSVLVESMDNFLRDRIQAEIEDFAKDKQALVAERVKYKSQVKEHISALNEFINKNLAKEISEFKTDRVKMRENVAELEEFLIQKLSEEIQDFHNDKKSLVEQKVKLVSEGKQQIAEAKRSFIKQAAVVVENTINDLLRKEISQYREDIIAARENDFGRRIFEAFIGEYMTSHLNEGSEVKKLSKVIESQMKEIENLKESVSEKQTVVEGVQKQLNVAKDMVKRNKLMTKLLAPLGKDKRKVMEELLQTVETEKLSESYNKYLPAVLNESVVNRVGDKRVITESTGDKKPNLVQGEDSTLAVEINKLKNLAGI